MKHIFIIMLCGVLFLTGCRKDSAVVQSCDDRTETFSTSEQPLTTEQVVYVYVCGHVEKPGVYQLPAGARICDALSLAGGVSQDGRPEAVSQAQKVSDGETLYVPGLDENPGEPEEGQEEDGRINLNTAQQQELMTLPGIGQSKADDILHYREEHGAFGTIEDLMNIPGIKEGIFNKIKDYIKV